MDIGANAKGVAARLSNFQARRFIIDGITCHSMEGFLQSLKRKDPNIQAHICTLTGVTAKRSGKNKKWWKTQTLHWLDKAINRHSDEYQNLITRAFDALAQNKGFRKDIIAAGNAVFRHSIGKNDPHKTVLTEREFTAQLKRVRDNIRKEEGLPPV